MSTKEKCEFCKHWQKENWVKGFCKRLKNETRYNQYCQFWKL